nr:transposase [Myxococcus vastator]
MALVKSAWGEDVYSGRLFAFVSRHGTRASWAPLHIECCARSPALAF